MNVREMRAQLRWCHKMHRLAIEKITSLDAQLGEVHVDLVALFLYPIAVL